METASVVFKQEFTKDMLDEITMLRSIRLSMAEKMLKDLDSTQSNLLQLGFNPSNEELKTELTSRIAELKSRQQSPNVIFADEIELYADLLTDVEGEEEGVEIEDPALEDLED